MAPLFYVIAMFAATPVAGVAQVHRPMASCYVQGRK